MQELQKEIAKIQKTLFTTSEKEAEAAKVQMYALQEVLKEVQAGPAISLACLLELAAGCFSAYEPGGQQTELRSSLA